MKKTFQAIALISLLVFSFFLTDKTSKVIKNLDEIMIMIKDNKKYYETNGSDASIIKNSIIPGISRRKVNVNKSYTNMKQYGKYNSDLYVYDYIKPCISISNNKDKYINLGNKIKRMVSLNFIVNDLNDLEYILDILKKEKVSGTFFVNEVFLSNNLDLIYNLIKEGYIIGINEDSNIEYMNTIITKIGKQKMIYCLYKNSKTMDMCRKINGYTIKGELIAKNYYRNVVEKLNNGVIFTFNKVNNLDLIIKYIKKRGYTITNLSEHLKEDIEKK